MLRVDLRIHSERIALVEDMQKGFRMLVAFKELGWILTDMAVQHEPFESLYVDRAALCL